MPGDEISCSRPFGYRWRSSKLFILTVISVAMFAGSWTIWFYGVLLTENDRYIPVQLHHSNSAGHSWGSIAIGSHANSISDIYHSLHERIVVYCPGIIYGLPSRQGIFKEQSDNCILDGQPGWHGGHSLVQNEYVSFAVICRIYWEHLALTFAILSDLVINWPIAPDCRRFNYMDCGYGNSR